MKLSIIVLVASAAAGVYAAAIRRDNGMDKSHSPTRPHHPSGTANTSSHYHHTSHSHLTASRPYHTIKTTKTHTTKIPISTRLTDRDMKSPSATLPHSTTEAPEEPMAPTGIPLPMPPPIKTTTAPHSTTQEPEEPMAPTGIPLPMPPPSNPTHAPCLTTQAPEEPMAPTGIPLPMPPPISGPFNPDLPNMASPSTIQSHSMTTTAASEETRASTGIEITQTWHGITANTLFPTTMATIFV